MKRYLSKFIICYNFIKQKTDQDFLSQIETIKLEDNIEQENELSQEKNLKQKSITDYFK